MTRRAKKNWHEESLAQRTSLSDRIADRITKFAGSMTFVYVHVIGFAVWCATGLFGLDQYPFNFLTMTVSLEAIFLATFVMIGQNRQEARDKVQAEHQYNHQETELTEQTEILKTLRSLTEEIHATIHPDKKMTTIVMNVSTDASPEEIAKLVTDSIAKTKDENDDKPTTPDDTTPEMDGKR